MDNIPENLQIAFSRFCILHDWTEAEVLAYLMLYAMKQGVDLAIPLHSQRLIIRKKGVEKWLTDQFARLDLDLD
jgi:hypothetical protein